jgi:hypothetical protein
MEFLVRGRLSWLRFPGFELGKPTPDENTIRLFRGRLADAGAIDQRGFRLMPLASLSAAGLRCSEFLVHLRSAMASKNRQSSVAQFLKSARPV